MYYHTILRQSPEFENRMPLSDGEVIRQGKRFHTLNITATEILDLFDGSRSVGEVIDTMGSRYPEQKRGQVIEAFILQLYDAGLLVE